MSNQQKKPNILFFFPDQMRADWTELNPEIPIRTPNLKKLSDNGVVFSNTYCASPLCSPSRSCLAVGKDYDHVNIRSNSQNHPDDDPTFYELIRDQAGYYTMTCGKLDFRHPEHSYGNDGKHIVNGIDYLAKWGFSNGIEIGGKMNGARTWRNEREKIDPYMVYLGKKGLADDYARDIGKRKFKDVHPSLLEDDDYEDNWIGRCGIGLLENAPKDKPWFIQVNFNNPHNPLDATKSMLEKYQNINFPLPIDHSKFSDEENQAIRRNYAAMIDNIDRWISLFLEIVEKRGELDNTIVIFSSDHGEMLGDHDKVQKSVPYDGAVRVPLFISGANIVKKKIVDTPVSLIDVFSTILDIAGVEIPKGVDSKSLVPSLMGNSPVEREVAKSGLGCFRVVVKQDFKLVVGYPRKGLKFVNKHKPKKKIEKTPVLLFNLKDDPNELKNIAQDHPQIVQSLMEYL